MKRSLTVLTHALLLPLGLLTSSLLHAEPTEMRDWTSTVGSKLQAKAISLKKGEVTFLTEEGRRLEVELSQLTPEDQSILKKHFPAISQLPPAPEAKAPALSQPLGKMLGPIVADDDSSYVLYLPTTLVEGIDAPIVFWTGWNRATINRMQPFVEAAELAGIVLAASVESSNNGGDTFRVNHDHTEACLKHIEKNFPVDAKRAFFSGSSGGGASAFYNAANLKCAGAMPMVGYIPKGAKPDKKAFYYVIGGANDYNRYHSAAAADRLGDHAAYRMHVGGHHVPITPAVAFEGTIWLYTRHLYEDSEKYAAEVAHFEPRFSSWLMARAKSSPHTAYFWTKHLLETCQIEGDFKELVSGLNETLAQSAENVRWLEAHRALEQFGYEHFVEVATRGSVGQHTTPAIQRGVEDLRENYSNLPEIDGILDELAKPTNATPK